MIIAEFCWRLFMRATFVIAYTVAVLSWLLLAWVAVSVPEGEIIERVPLIVFGGVPFALVWMADGLVSRKRSSD